MQRVKVSLKERSYEILIGAECLEGVSAHVENICPSGTVALVTNTTVFGLYGEKLLEALRAKALKVHTIVIPDGEQYKDYFWAYHILTEMLQAGLDRGSCLVALGGGVVGDIGAFCASLYMRGIALVQVPTTLLSQVDSSVGGKTGVNHPLGKNMIGTFYQPKLVWIDVSTLKTLPEREFLAGMAEVLKYGVILDREFFGFLEGSRQEILNLEPEVLQKVVKRCCELKAEVVSKDEREAGLRAILNYGHTIGHAIETLTNYRGFLHGEAVAVGMVAEAIISEALGYLNSDESQRIRTTINDYGLPVSIRMNIGPDAMLQAMARDKKARKGALTFVLPEQIGKVRIERDVPEVAVLEAISKVKEVENE